VNCGAVAALRRRLDGVEGMTLSLAYDSEAVLERLE
jgi:hypothetical protein